MNDTGPNVGTPTDRRDRDRGRVWSLAVFAAIVLGGGGLLVANDVETGILQPLSVWLTAVSGATLAALGVAVRYHGQGIGMIDGSFAIAIGSDGGVVVSCHDVTGQSLKFAKCSPQGCDGPGDRLFGDGFDWRGDGHAAVPSGQGLTGPGDDVMYALHLVR